jgi:sugar-specific transcriptional regulator TrmB
VVAGSFAAAILGGYGVASEIAKALKIGRASVYRVLESE